MLAHRYSKRPSEIVGLENEWTAWQLDEACARVGLQVEADALRGKSSFAEPASGKQAAPFASMKNRALKKMKIPKSGIW